MFEATTTQFRRYLAYALNYRVIIVLWAIAGFVQAFISLAVWGAIADGGSLPGGWGRSSFAAWFLLVLVIEEFTHTWVFWSWEWRVRQGAFSGVLLKPQHPLVSDVIDNLAVKVVSIAVKAPIALAVAWSWGIHPDLLSLRAVATVAAVLGAYALRTLLEACIACLAFWVTRIGAIVSTWYVLWAFLSGQFAPIELLPGPMRVVAEASPIRWALAFPIEVATGRRTGADLYMGFAMQLMWIAISAVCFAAAWRFSKDRFTAVGS